MVFGRNLFRPRRGRTWSPEDDHLAQMIELFGDFPPEFVAKAPNKDKFFDEYGPCLGIQCFLSIGILKQIKQYHRTTLEEHIRSRFPAMVGDDVDCLAHFLRRMLQYENRARAMDLAHHA
jgi:serine/threonine-protein kinase SRPK3